MKLISNNDIFEIIYGDNNKIQNSNNVKMSQIVDDIIDKEGITDNNFKKKCVYYVYDNSKLLVHKYKFTINDTEIPSYAKLKCIILEEIADHQVVTHKFYGSDDTLYYDDMKLNSPNNDLNEWGTKLILVGKPIIFVCGNDGVGKTTTVDMLNKLYPEYMAYERSSPYIDEGLKHEIDKIDKMTLKYSYDTYIDLRHEILINNVMHKIYWFILDLPVESIEKRIKGRIDKTIWESPKALVYFRNRFREMSAYYGLPFISTEYMDTIQICNEIKNIINSNMYDEINLINTKNMSFDYISQMDIEKLLYDNMSIPKYIIDEFNDNIKYDENNIVMLHVVQNISQSQEFHRKVLIRWILNKYDINYDGSSIIIGTDTRVPIISRPKIIIKLIAEGESKKVYRIITDNKYLKNIVIIILKSTIYSHSKQATGYIENLGSIRGTGSKIFLEMFWRNGINHSYRSIGNNGIIVSDYVETNPVEIVFKRFCEGTDKHSYHGLLNIKDLVLDSSGVVLKTGEYKNGPYIRFDWRNPNHIFTNSRNNVTDCIYYYVLEEYYGKEQFFTTILSNNTEIKPFGDKCVSEDLLHGLIDIDKCRETAIKVYCTIDSYLSKVGLEVKDGCMMLNSDGTMCWSEVNQDCMRITTSSSNESLDKDIWRSGGSASKQLIVEKWNHFNGIIKKYFEDNTIIHELKKYNHYGYQETAKKILSDSRLNISPKYREIYEKFDRICKNRRVILTMDLYDRKPVLVKSGKILEIHSNGKYVDAFEKISIHPDILVVDLNGAIDNNNSINRDIIKKLATDHYIHAGGGIRTLEDAQDILGSSARRIVVSSNTDREFINKIPKERLIVELSIDQYNNVLINGRKTNTGIKYSQKIKELVDMSVEAISLTFHDTEGHLNGIPRNQIYDILEVTPDRVKKIIIAGGISNIEDLEFLWSFERVIPQLGSAIWKNKITIGQIYSSMGKYDKDNIMPSIIQDKYGMVKGLVYMNKESVIKSIDTGMLHRYSREYKKVMCKGETSGDYQKVTKVSLDCDSDALLITVDTNKPLCHTGNFSCFSNQSIIKSNINTLNQYIKSRKGGNSYSGNIQNYSGLALAKVMEEFWEVVCATDEYQISECSDFMVHFIMYLNSKNVSLDDVLNELNARRWNPHLVDKKSNKNKHDSNQIVIGVTSEKYSTKSDNFAKDHLGFEIMRPIGKNLKINYSIVDQYKYEYYFGNKTISIVPLRPKDMSWMLASGTIDCVITYNSVMENKPMVYKKILEVPDNDLSLVLIKRKGDIIVPDAWSSEKKVVIATESINYINEFLTNSGISSDHYTLTHVSGTSESFLVNDTKTNYLLCDAIVETGRTIEENNLEIWKYVKKIGDIKIGLYSRLNHK